MTEWMAKLAIDFCCRKGMSLCSISWASLSMRLVGTATQSQMCQVISKKNLLSEAELEDGQQRQKQQNIQPLFILRFFYISCGA